MSTIIGSTTTISIPTKTKIYPQSFDWGDESATAGETWFAALAQELYTNGAQDSWVGKQKSVILTSAVLGTTTHLIRCIGVNQDGEKTATFQTSNTLANTIAFGSNSAAWIGSTARAVCINYYDAFPGKAYIKTVSKGTCPSTNDSRNGTPTYNNETVWLPSEREMGLDSYAPISTSNSTTSKAECTQGYNAAYSYYNSDSRRVKKQGDSGSAVGYWERSRYYNSSRSGEACSVNTSGGANTNDSYNTIGLAPAFVIYAQNISINTESSLILGPTLHVASSDPTSSDGADGDFWFVYEE